MNRLQNQITCSFLFFTVLFTLFIDSFISFLKFILALIFLCTYLSVGIELCLSIHMGCRGVHMFAFCLMFGTVHVLYCFLKILAIPFSTEGSDESIWWGWFDILKIFDKQTAFILFLVFSFSFYSTSVNNFFYILDRFKNLNLSPVG